MAKLTLNNVTSGYQSSTASNANNDLIEAAVENTLSRDGASPNQMEADLDMNSNDILNANVVATQSVTIAGTSVVPGDTLTVPDASNVPFTQTGTDAVLSDVDAKLNEIISVKDFGATGDGVTDDTAAIQAALDAAFALTPQHSASVYVPPGIYLLTSALTMRSDTGIFGHGGMGMRSTKFLATTDITMLQTLGTSGLFYEGCTVKGIYFDRTSVTNGTTPHINFINSVWGTIEDVYCQGSASPATSSAVSGIWITNNNVTWAQAYSVRLMRVALNHATIKVDGISDVTINESDIWGGRYDYSLEVVQGASLHMNTTDVIAGVGAGVYIHGSATQNYSIRIFDCDIVTNITEFAANTAVLAEDAQRLVVSGCNIAARGIGISLKDCTGARITNNAFFTCGRGTKNSANVTFTDAEVDTGNGASGNSVNLPSHTLATGDQVLLTTTGTLPGGLATATTYWVIDYDTDNIQFATTLANASAGTDIDITSAAGGGTHTIQTLDVGTGGPYGDIKVLCADNGTSAAAQHVTISDNYFEAWDWRAGADPAVVKSSAVVLEQDATTPTKPTHVYIHNNAVRRTDDYLTDVFDVSEGSRPVVLSNNPQCNYGEGNRSILSFYSTDVLQNQANDIIVMKPGGSDGNSNIYTLPVAGTVIGISMRSNTAITAGSCVATVYLTSSDTVTCSATLSAAGDDTAQSANFLPGTYNFAAGGTIGVRMTTDAGFLPSGSADIQVDLIVSI